MSFIKEDTNLLFLISNPDKRKNNDINIKERNLLKEYIIKKFDLYNDDLLNIIYQNITTYINNIDTDLLIINNILENIIIQIIDE